MSIKKRRLIKAKFSKTPKELFKDLFWDSIKEGFDNDIRYIADFTDVFMYVQKIYDKQVNQEIPKGINFIKNYHRENLDENETLTEEQISDIIWAQEELGNYKFNDLVKNDDKLNIVKIVKKHWDEEIHKVFTNPRFEYDLEKEEESPMMETKEFHKYISDMKKGAEELLDEYVKSNETNLFKDLQRSFDDLTDDGVWCEDIASAVYRKLKQEGIAK